MKNQFFYLRKEENPVKIEGVEPTFKEYLDSFSLNKVIRSLEMEDGRRLVLLDDIHERLQTVPQYNKDHTKIVGQTKERNTFQSEVYLSKEESVKYVELCQ